MMKSSLDKPENKKKKKSGKVVTMPDKTGDQKNQETGVAGADGGDKAPRKSGRKPGKKEVEEEEHKGAKKALRQAVRAEVKKRKEKIAEALVNRIGDGDMRGAAMVLSLMEHGNKEGEDGKKRHGGLKLIDLLESDTEWEGEEAEAPAGAGTEKSEAASEQESKRAS
jgi:hypothetical protein